MNNIAARVKKHNLRASHSMVAFNGHHAAINIKVEGNFESLDDAEEKMDAFIREELDCPTLNSVLDGIITYDSISWMDTNVLCLSLNEHVLNLPWGFLLEVSKGANNIFLQGLYEAVQGNPIDNNMYEQYAYTSGYYALEGFADKGSFFEKKKSL